MHLRCIVWYDGVGYTLLISLVCSVRTASYGPSFSLPFFCAWAMKTRNEKTRIYNLPYGLRKTKLTRCLLYGFVHYSRKRTKYFDVLTGDQELEVRTATYGPEITQSQHAKSVSHIIMHYILLYCDCLKYSCC